MGHVFRMLVLAQELVETGGCCVRFLTRPFARTLELVAERGFAAEILGEGEGNVFPFPPGFGADPPAVLINDILDTLAEYMEAVRPLAGRIANLDDQGAGLARADLVINSLPCRFVAPGGAAKARYLEGPEYLILAPEFQRRRPAGRPISNACASILVTLGGSDTYGYSIPVVQALRQLGELQRIAVVLGPAFQHHRPLAEAVEGDGRFQLSRSVPSLARVMESHELAITGGGMTLFEAAALGLPTLALASEDFERENIRWGQGRGFTRYLGEGRKLSPEAIAAEVQSLLGDWALRREMSLAGPRAVDGQGARRVAELILDKAP
jgi:spore coat polysaccharide biosynthesis predicted glycosyltransferase SpsG